MRCEQVVRDDVAQRYLLGTLAEEDRDAFERHWFECARCFSDLETLRALRQALPQGAEGLEVPEPRARWPPWAWAAAATVVLGVGAGWYWSSAISSRPHRGAHQEVSQGPDEPPPDPPRPQSGPAPPLPSEVGPPAAGLPTPQARAPLAALALVQPPAYAPSLLRGTQDAAARRFREAMLHYARGDFAAAKAGLEAAAALDPQASDIAFFLGAATLLIDQPEPAIEQLRRTIALGQSPYLEEAHFFLAKAHLKLGDVDAATAQLEEAIRMGGEREQEARVVLQQLRALRTSP
jgi:tetratricopeptide (TPR) repeat protein